MDGEYAANLMENIKELENEWEKVALTAGVDQKKVRVHRVILAASSKFFANMLGTKISQAEHVNDFTLDGLDGNLLERLVSFLYTGNLELDAKNVPRYLYVAQKYQLEALELKCVRFRARLISIDNCISLLLLGDQQHEPELKEEALQIVCKEFEAIPAHEMCQLDCKTFAEVLERDTITAPEEVIFDRLVQWICFDEMDRSKHAADLIKLIRLKHIATKALVEKVDVICARFQLVEFTKPEYVKRLLCPTVFRNHRFGRKVAVYELRRNDSENLHIRRHLCGTEWENLVTMGVEERMKYCGIVFCDENFFILGGSAGEDKFTKAVFSYHMEAKTREKLPNMLNSRDDFQPVMIDEFIYVFGGFDGTVALSGCERFDTKLKKWKTLKPMIKRRYGYTTAVLNGCIFVAGGMETGDEGEDNTVQRYDSTKNKWEKVASLTNPRFYGVLTEWKGILYAIGLNAESVSIIERYNSARNEWELLDASDAGDYMLQVLSSFPLKRKDGYRQQIEVRNHEYFDRILNEDSKKTYLAHFQSN